MQVVFGYSAEQAFTFRPRCSAVRSSLHIPSERLGKRGFCNFPVSSRMKLLASEVFSLRIRPCSTRLSTALLCISRPTRRVEAVCNLTSFSRRVPRFHRHTRIRFSCAACFGSISSRDLPRCVITGKAAELFFSMVGENEYRSFAVSSRMKLFARVVLSLRMRPAAIRSLTARLCISRPTWRVDVV